MISVKAAKAIANKPLFNCGFRPFFLGGALYAVMITLAWGAGLAWPGLVPMPGGGSVLWHSQEMIWGFATAALCGFLLTAVPSFTQSPAIRGAPLATLFALWCAGRFAALGTATPLHLLNAICDLATLAGLLYFIGRPLSRSAEHRSLGWALLALLAVSTGYQYSRFGGGDPAAWIRLALVLLIVFIVLAVRRIGMRIVNLTLDRQGIDDRTFMPRPPHTRIAVVCLLLHGAAEFSGLRAPVTAWLALAAGAAVFNLTNDWHLGRVLLRRWVAFFYVVLWMVALGYTVMGLVVLTGGPPAWMNGGRHLVAIGGIGLATLAVFCIAGRSHAGHELDERPWVLCAAAMIILSALTRLAFAMDPQRWYLAGVSALAWAGAFALYLLFFRRILTGPRLDGDTGC